MATYTNCYRDLSLALRLSSPVIHDHGG